MYMPPLKLWIILKEVHSPRLKGLRRHHIYLYLLGWSCGKLWAWEGQHPCSASTHLSAVFLKRSVTCLSSLLSPRWTLQLFPCSSQKCSRRILMGTKSNLQVNLDWLIPIMPAHPSSSQCLSIYPGLLDHYRSEPFTFLFKVTAMTVNASVLL